MANDADDLGAWVEGIVRGFVNGSAENALMNEAHERAWGDPLVGFSSGSDPLYRFYKEDIGSFFLTPAEWFEAAFPGTDAEGDDLTVISWVLPQTAATKAEHRLPRAMPTERWARARIYGEAFNDRLRRHVVERLEEAGYKAVAPMLSRRWSREESERYGFASNWSERHAAYASGLGTFGLCDGLITQRGKAIRAGSVVAKVVIQPTEREYEDHHAYCLHYADGTCLECVDRCPAGAISDAGHDKERCNRYVRATEEYVESNFGFLGYGCGLCQTGVSCESRIPRGIPL